MNEGDAESMLHHGAGLGKFGKCVDKMMMATMVKKLLALLCLVALCLGQKKRRQQTLEWDPKVYEEKMNTRGCSNLTQVLDNWKFAIMTQVKELLLNDHSVVLPEYGRIQPLSDALGDLYKEFDALKGRLGELTSKFEGVETFADEIRAGKIHRPPLRVVRPPLPPPREERRPIMPAAAGLRQWRRNRVLIRKIKRPEGPQA
ncbi:hypothetical protein AGOR_G00226090 [Albula goreensis]|uniref:Uncharacterized protein n=1 Tax=Albula goreensis TaxID=1534307 RepID=A0A8T3CKD6_9TELE|nr:hypothetical protein AGOR_G00226090 [Albula goreensis]